jgi:hypothetical protein
MALLEKSLTEGKMVNDFLEGKSLHTKALFTHFISQYRKIGPISIKPAKTMIGIATQRRRIAYVTQLGKNFVHIVFPFKQAYPENLCFQKIAQVPKTSDQFNHHLRIYERGDINKEVMKFMKLAFEQGQ